LHVTYAKCNLPLAAVIACMATLAQPCSAQDVAITGAEAGPEAPAVPDYVIPDFHGIFIDTKPSLDSRYVSVRLGLEVIGDWTGFNQDDTSIAQVGVQQDQFELRSAGLDIEGELGARRWIHYKVGIQYNGFNTNGGKALDVTDFAFTFDVDKWRTRVKFGQIKENFSYEVVGNTAKLPQNERTMSPFSAPRNPGISVIHVIGPEQRMTVSYGIYKDQSESAGGSFGVAARVTALVWGAPGNGDAFLHLGASLLHSGSDSAAEYRARPGSNVADYYVDTGEIAVNGANHVGLEAQYSNVHGWAVLSEYVVARVDTANLGTRNMHGFYVIGSWVLTGESRPYDRTNGVVTRIVPKGRWGAPELFARYSFVDLNDGPIQGGRYDRYEIGLNWWATTQWKLGLVAGHVNLERYGVNGVTNSFLTRLQWVY